MPCERIDLGGGAVGFVRRSRRASCSVPGCPREHDVLCDWKLHGKKKGKTCDAKLCAQHSVKPAPDKDLCPAHAKAWENWKAARAAKGGSDVPG